MLQFSFTLAVLSKPRIWGVCRENTSAAIEAYPPHTYQGIGDRMFWFVKQSAR